MSWLRKTRGVPFELARHFLRRMFDCEWSSSPGQWSSAAIGLISLFLPAGLLLVREGAADPKYASRYRLLALVSCVAGLLALLQWQAMFPSRRDFLAMASLPVRPRQIFAARFSAVLLFSTLVIAAMNLLPSLIAPIEFGGGWRLDASFAAHALAQAAASSLACFFVFFAILAIQGLLLNLLPAALSARISLYVQGLLAGVFLLGGFYSWSMKEWTALPRFAALLPPVWFTGLHQSFTGDTTPFFAAMARRALFAAAIAVTLSAVTYLLSYRRYRKLLLESPVRLATSAAWRSALLRLLAGSPRREAIIGFLAQTLARSRTHRLMWFVYIGAAAAVMLNSSLIDGALFVRSSQGWVKALRFLVLFWPLACSVVILSGFRHLLSIPAELRANWIFQLTESQGRAEWMSAVERFVMAWAVAPIYLVLFPVAAYVLGWAVACRLGVLQLLITLSIFELLFHSWQKLPFTCSYVPGQRPLVAIVAGYIAVLCAIMPILSVMIAASSAFAPLFPIYLLNFGAIWFWLRRQRRQGWGESKLLYEDVPAVVTDLGIKDITLVGQPILAAAAFQPASAYPKFTSSQSSPPEAPSSLRQ